MRISQADWDELVAHAREEAPERVLRLLLVRATAGSRASRAASTSAAPRTATSSTARACSRPTELDDEGRQVGSYHSHPRSPAEPSQTDINLAQLPDWLYVIVSLDGEPSVRAWWMRDGKVEEERLEVV